MENGQFWSLWSQTHWQDTLKHPSILRVNTVVYNKGLSTIVMCLFSIPKDGVTFKCNNNNTLENWARARAQANFLSALKLWIILLYIFFSSPLKALSFERERKFSPGLSMDYEEDTLSDNQILMMLCYRYRMGPSPKACHGLRGGIWRPTSGSKAPGFQDSKVPGFQNSKVPRHWNLTCTMHMILYGEVF